MYIYNTSNTRSPSPSLQKNTYPLYVVPKSTPTIKRSIPRNSDAAIEAAEAKEELDDAVAVRIESGRMFMFPKASVNGRAMVFREGGRGEEGRGGCGEVR